MKITLRQDSTDEKKTAERRSRLTCLLPVPSSFPKSSLDPFLTPIPYDHHSSPNFSETPLALSLRYLAAPFPPPPVSGRSCPSYASFPFQTSLRIPLYGPVGPIFQILAHTTDSYCSFQKSASSKMRNLRHTHAFRCRFICRP